MACKLCGNVGVVVYQKKIDGKLYDHGAKCICKFGMHYSNLPSISKISRAEGDRYKTNSHSSYKKNSELKKKGA